MAVLTRYVNPNSTAGGDGTTNATTGANRAYVSLSAWEAAQQQNLDTGNNIAECICETGGNADTTNVTITGWTTSATDYIIIKTSAGHRAAGLWNTAKYRLINPNSFSGAIDVQESYVRIEGLQVQNTASSDAYAAVRQDGAVGGVSDLRLDTCIMRGGTTVEGTVYFSTSVSSMTNCVVYGCVGGPGVSSQDLFTTPAITITNCTIIGGDYAVDRNGGNIAIRNSYCHGGTDAYVGTNITKTTCAHSSATTFTGSTASIAHSTANFTNVTGGSEDYHLVSGASSTLLAGGTDYSGTFTKDIDGETRTVPYSIGADQIIAAGVTVTPSTASLVLTTFAPSIIRVIPATKALTLSAFAPTVIAPRLCTPATLALTTTKLAPAIKLAVIPPTTALTITTLAPTVSTPRLCTPTTAALTITTFAPTVAAPRLVTPSTASITLAAFPPTVSTPQLVTPSTLSLSLTAFAPTVSTPRVVTPATTALVLSSFAPTIALPKLVTPATAALTVSTFTPSVGQPQTVTPGTKSLAITTLATLVSTPRTVTPSTAALTLTRHAPTVSDGSSVSGAAYYYRRYILARRF